MPPRLALLLTFVFCVYLFRRDLKQPGTSTGALWLPFAWLLVACSREIAEWMQLFGLPTFGGSLEGGSPLDRLVYLTMILLGFNILRTRNFLVSDLITKNIWLFIFLLYCFLAVFWSDFPFVSLKRWIKVLGHPIMALIILTEPNPRESLIRLLRRCGFILIPVSVLFIKYYPEWGRGFSFWTGEAYNTGITTDKNALGINCLILGYIYVWHFLLTLKQPKSKERKFELWLTAFFIYLNGWLLSMANSKTPLVGLLLGVTVMLFVGFKWVRKPLVPFYIISATIVIAIAQSLFGVYEMTLRLLGKDPTLTDRTLLWADLLKVEINPLIGTGFEGFWLGDRLKEIWKIWAFAPNQAHNGYLETYLNLGALGLVILLILLLSTFLKSCRSIITDVEWGRFRLGFLLAIIVYNWTEAAFKTTHPIFFIFYLTAIDLTVRNAISEAGVRFRSNSRSARPPQPSSN